MRRFLSVDSFGYVFGYSTGPEPPSPDWVEIDFDASAAMTSMNLFQLVNGVLVDSGTPKLPPMPYLRWVNGAWTDVRDLAQVKADKWSAIKAKRSEVEFGGFTWDGSVFDSDPLSQSRIQGAAQLATINPTTFTIDWTLADNSVRSLSASQMVEVGETLGIHVATQHTVARGLRQQIDAASTVTEVEAITWP